LIIVIIGLIALASNVLPLYFCQEPAAAGRPHAAEAAEGQPRGFALEMGKGGFLLGSFDGACQRYLLNRSQDRRGQGPGCSGRLPKNLSPCWGLSQHGSLLRSRFTVWRRLKRAFHHAILRFAIEAVPEGQASQKNEATDAPALTSPGCIDCAPSGGHPTSRDAFPTTDG
jgi:hypothetical protein